jgi:hypothetical protein
MEFENTEVFNFDGAFRGMRNPLNSWAKSDSYSEDGNFVIGENDMDLARRLIGSGDASDRKFLRQILVCVDITAPLYWWKEFDTYKVGTVANSTSTMHKISTTPITLDCFELDDFNSDLETIDGSKTWNLKKDMELVLFDIENLRRKYIDTKDKRYWKELIRWLPEGWLQTRTVTMNYENLRAMYHQRKHHKLNEWSGKDNPALPNFCAWVKALPYAKELIIDDQRR